MTVIDASALIDMLLGNLELRALVRGLVSSGSRLNAPHLIDLEVAQALRRAVAAGLLDEDRAREALADLADLPLTRHPHTVLLGRIWELRHNVTAYDAAYLALAEGLHATLLTRDGRLAQAPGHRAEIDLV